MRLPILLAELVGVLAALGAISRLAWYMIKRGERRSRRRLGQLGTALGGGKGTPTVASLSLFMRTRLRFVDAKDHQRFKKLPCEIWATRSGWIYTIREDVPDLDGDPLVLGRAWSTKKLLQKIQRVVDAKYAEGYKLEGDSDA